MQIVADPIEFHVNIYIVLWDIALIKCFSAFDVLVNKVY
jgi:hypothetical protein